MVCLKVDKEARWGELEIQEEESEEEEEEEEEEQDGGWACGGPVLRFLLFLGRVECTIASYGCGRCAV